MLPSSLKIYVHYIHGSIGKACPTSCDATFPKQSLKHFVMPSAVAFHVYGNILF